MINFNVTVLVCIVIKAHRKAYYMPPYYFTIYFILEIDFRLDLKGFKIGRREISQAVLF